MSRVPERSLFTEAHDLLADLGHILIGGASGFGKSFLLILLLLARLRDPRFGVHLVDPDGEVAAYCVEACANPANGLQARTLHYLQPASPSETFGLSLLYVPERTPQLCHEAALRTRTIFEQVLNFGTGDYGPRLSKLYQLGCYGLALAGRPLVDLPDLFTLGAARLREHIGESYPYEFMSQEWRSLDVLGERNPTRFLEYCESITSRLMPTFGNPRMRRIFGQSKGLDLARILAAREAVVLDLSGLEHKDAVLIGSAYVSLLFHEALTRPPRTAPHAFVAIDEVFDYMTSDLARAFDRLRKRNIQLCVALQRLGQLQKSGDDDKVAIRNAILTNTAIKIFFGGFDPDDAELLARLLFTGALNLAEWKPGSERPVAVGQDKTSVANWSRAETNTESETHGTSRSRAHGAGHGIISTSSTSRGTGVGAGESYGQVLTPPIQLLGPSAENASFIPMPLSQSTGESTSLSSFEQTSESSGETFSEFALENEGRSDARAISRGSSRSDGASEVFVTRYEWLPSTMFTLAEQQHRATGELMNQAPRDVFVKVRGDRPFRARTADLPPAFKSAEFRQLFLPRYRANATARSPYIRSADEVDAELVARFTPELPKPEKPEPDWLEPEPFEYPDPPSPPDAPRLKPNLRIVQRDTDQSR